MKIMVVGAGGIGGLMAARLCRQEGNQVTLIARGEQLAAIREKGLTLHDDGETFTVRPGLVTNDPGGAGIQDAVLLCTKGYGLSAALESIRPVVDEHTLIVPFLNGVNTAKRIFAQLQKGRVCDGLIYVFSRKGAPGEIIKTGSMLRVLFGLPDNRRDEDVLAFLDVLLDAGLDAEIPDDINREMWIKWFFICGNAQVTSYYDISVGELCQNPQAWAMLTAVLDELGAVAEAEGVDLPPDLIETTEKKLRAMAYESRSSLSRDLAIPGGPTELSLFGAELMRMAQIHGIDVPVTRKIMEKFQDRI